MTIVRTDFDYAAKIRKHGHRKICDVLIRETVPFEIADFASSDAPGALAKGAKPCPRGSETIRAVMDGLFAPVIDADGRPIAAAQFAPQSGKLHTELCETPVETLFLTGQAGIETIRAPVQAGHHLMSSEREKYHAEVCRRVASSLASIDGVLHMRIPEPMYVVTVEWRRGSKSKPAVLVDFDQTPGFRCPPGIDSRGAIGHFRLDQREAADLMAETVADRLGFQSEKEFVKELTGKFDSAQIRERMRRPNEPNVVDASLLRADPLLVTLEQSIRSLLRLGHEALAAAPDEFVLAWADMRESLALIESGHADAATMAADAMRSFLAHAPTEPDQFATAADKRRWDTRTLPLLMARTIVIDALSTGPEVDQAAAAECVGPAR